MPDTTRTEKQVSSSSSHLRTSTQRDAGDLGGASALRRELQHTARETLQLGSNLRNRVLAHLGQSSDIGAVDDVAPLIDTVLKVDRQVDRFVNVLLRMEELQTRRPVAASGDSPTSGSHSFTGAGEEAT